MTEKCGRGGQPRKHQPRRHGPEDTTRPPPGPSSHRQPCVAGLKSRSARGKAEIQEARTPARVLRLTDSRKLAGCLPRLLHREAPVVEPKGGGGSSTWTRYTNPPRRYEVATFSKTNRAVHRVTLPRYGCLSTTVGAVESKIGWWDWSRLQFCDRTGSAVASHNPHRTVSGTTAAG
jgi:hypothetical protein